MAGQAQISQASYSHSVTAAFAMIAVLWLARSQWLQKAVAWVRG